MTTATMTPALAAAPDFLNSPPPTPSQPRTYGYTSQAEYTPPSSGESPDNSYSPVSPRAWNIPSHLQSHSRQLRPPKSPMYVPAVLRPTEKPVRHSPPKANRMSVGNTDGGIDMEGSGYGSVSMDGIAPGINRIVTEEWNEEMMGQVTGSPSRNHWKPDSASLSCDDESCEKNFTFFERRHHCRRCGRIYCGEHSAHHVPLDQHARFHPRADKSRCCNLCWNDYRTWEVARVSRSNSTNSRDSTIPSTPNVPFMRGARDAGAQVVGSIAKSVPRDWNWSTF